MKCWEEIELTEEISYHPYMRHVHKSVQTHMAFFIYFLSLKVILMSSQ